MPSYGKRKRSSSSRSRGSKRVKRTAPRRKSRGGNRRIRARTNSAMSVSKPVRATNANRRRKAVAPLKFEDLALALYPKHHIKQNIGTSFAWNRGTQGYQTFEFGMPDQVLKNIVTTLVNNLDMQDSMINTGAQNWYPWTNDKGALMVVESFPSDASNNDAPTTRWIPNKNSKLMAVIGDQKYKVEITNPDQMHKKVTIITSRPKRYLYSTAQTVVGCWHEDFFVNQPPNDPLSGGSSGVVVPFTITTGSEGQDVFTWPLAPVQTDLGVNQIIEGETILGERPFARRNTMVHHNHTKIGQIEKILAPGETFVTEVVIPAYKFYPHKLLKDLEMERKDHHAQLLKAQIQSNQAVIDAAGGAAGYIPINTQHLETMPRMWDKGKSLTIIAESQNTFATFDYESAMMQDVVDEGDRDENARAIKANSIAIQGSGQLFVNVKQSIMTRALPIRQIDSYTFQELRDRTIPVNGVETVINTETDSHVRVVPESTYP